MADFMAGNLTRAAAETWWNTQPEMADQLAERIRGMVDIALAHGRKFTPKEKYQITLLTDPTFEHTGRTKRFRLIQMLQDNYGSEAQQTPPPQPGGPPAPGSPKAVAGLNSTYQSAFQGLQGRLAKR